MPLYRYESYDKQGKKVSGTVEATSAQGAKDIVRGQNLLPFKIIEVNVLVAGFSLTSLFEKGVDHKSKILFTKQLSVLLKNGIPLLQAISLLAEQFDGKMQRILINVKDDLKGGESLANCLADYPKVFSNVYVQLVRAGESSGKLEAVLERLIEYLERAEETRKRIRKAMAYPIFMISFAVAVAGGLVAFVVPSVTKAFSQTGSDLPGPTQFLLNLSEFLTDNFLFIVVFFALLLAAFLYWKSTRRGKHLFDRFLLRVPIFSYLVKTKAVVQFCKTLGLLLESGVNLAEALDIVTNIIDNSVLTGSLKAARDKIIKEGKIAHYLKETRVFPDIASYMIDTGEKSGELAGMLSTVGNDYDIALSELIDSLVGKINPIMMFVVGGLVFFIIIAMFMPMLQMGEALGL